MPYDLSLNPGPFTGNLITRIESHQAVKRVEHSNPKTRKVNPELPPIWFLPFTAHLIDGSYIDGGIEYQKEAERSGTNVLSHTYTFERDNWYLRYDYDPEQAEPFKHPEYHIHVNKSQPRYPFARWDIVDFVTFLYEQDLIEE